MECGETVRGASGERDTEDVQLSLIVPCYNEEGNVAPFFNAATACFDASGIVYELVFVDDGSADSTMEALHALMDADDGLHRVRVVGFSRNFGKEAALFAGMQEACGDCIGFIDADLQQDPEVALSLYRHLEKTPACDVAAACQVNRRESGAMKAFKGLFYRLFNAASDDVSIPADVSDFRVFRRSVAEALLSLPEYFRFSKGLFAWVGFKTDVMPYEPKSRLAGDSAWNFSSLFHYAVNGILSFTTWPLKIAIYLGLIASLGSILYLLYVLIVDYLIMGIAIPGYPTLVCLVLLFGGMQLLVLGIIGEYLARAYIEGKRRPIYVARERFRSEKREP